MDSKTIKEIVDIAEPLATIIAILVGGFWGYMLFVRNRQKYPRAKISHQIAHKKISDEKVLLHVSTKISNIGNVLLSIISGRTWVQQVIPSQKKVLDSIPTAETEINWPSIGDKITKWEEGKFEIEPGEDDQICYDFVIDADVQTVKVYSYFENIKKRGRDLGWSWTTIYDLKEKEMSQNPGGLKMKQKQKPLKPTPPKKVKVGKQQPLKPPPSSKPPTPTKKSK